MGNKSDILLPPWIAFPEISSYDMFWRMGRGEDYIEKWARWFNTLSTVDQNEYIAEYPAEGEWASFYDD